LGPEKVSKNPATPFWGRNKVPGAELEAMDSLSYVKKSRNAAGGRKQTPAAELEATESLKLYDVSKATANSTQANIFVRIGQTPT